MHRKLLTLGLLFSPTSLSALAPKETEIICDEGTNNCLAIETISGGYEGGNQAMAYFKTGSEQNWRRIKPLTERSDCSQHLRAMTCYDQTTCIVVGNENFGKHCENERNVILLTHDGNRFSKMPAEIPGFCTIYPPISTTLTLITCNPKGERCVTVGVCNTAKQPESFQAFSISRNKGQKKWQAASLQPALPFKATDSIMNRLHYHKKTKTFILSGISFNDEQKQDVAYSSSMGDQWEFSQIDQPIKPAQFQSATINLKTLPSVLPPGVSQVACDLLEEECVGVGTVTVPCDNSGRSCTDSGSTGNSFQTDVVAYYTENGGLSWQSSLPLEQPYCFRAEILDLACDTQIQNCVTIGLQGYNHECYPETIDLIYHTKNGGQKFEMSVINNSYPFTCVLTTPYTKIFDSVVLDPLGIKGMALGNCQYDPYPLHTRAIAFITEDGGASFSAPRTLPLLPTDMTASELVKLSCDPTLTLCTLSADLYENDADLMHHKSNATAYYATINSGKDWTLTTISPKNPATLAVGKNLLASTSSFTLFSRSAKKFLDHVKPSKYSEEERIPSRKHM